MDGKAINNTSDGIFIADKHYIIVYVNSAYEVYWQSQEQALNAPLRFGNHPQEFEADVKDALKADKHWSGEIETFPVLASGMLLIWESTQ